MRNKKLIDDINYLFKTLPRKHKDLYALISKDEFIMMTDRVVALVDNKDFKQKDFPIVLQMIFAKIRDAHSMVDRYQDPKTPFYFEHINGTYAPVVVSKETKKLLLTKLKSINGYSIEEFSRLIDKYIIYDNPEAQKLQISRSLSDWKLINYVTSNKNKYITYVFADGTKVKSKKRLKSTMQTSIYWTEGLEFLRERPSYFLLSKGNALYIKYSRCREDQDYPLKQFTREIRAAIKKNTPSKIVVDFRNNHGGNSSLFDQIADVLKSDIDKNKPKVYCLINRKVFSSGTLNTYDVKYKLGATVVGQPASQGINHFGYTHFFELPNSKVEIRYSSEYWKFIDGNDPVIKPDVYIEPTIADYKNGNDPVLQYCLD